MDQKVWNLGNPGVKVTVVNFWFAGCKPCVEEIPELNALVGRYAKDSVEFGAFSLDTEEMIKQFLAKNPFHYRIIPNARETAEKLGITSYPTHLVIDEEGRVRYHGIGYEDDTVQNLGQVIDGLLGKLR